ncbi:MAG: metallophosphoesterase family protein [Pseudomonadota bacterium]
MNSGIRLLLPLVLFTMMGNAGCDSSDPQEAADSIQHTLADEPLPWTQQRTDYDPDAVRFAVFADITGGERDGVFATAIEQLNLLRPELIINVGDLIEGSRDPFEINEQWDRFESSANSAHAPIFYVGGNHDLLGDEMRRVWERRIGPRYYHFRYRDVLFLVLDTEDHAIERIEELAELRDEMYRVAAESGWDAAGQTTYANLPENETGAISAAQADYMTEVLADHTDVTWTFLLMHKAPWAGPDMPAWRQIEDALGKRPYTVFQGHRHALKHTERNGRDYIRLATTGGVPLPGNGPTFDHVVWVTVDATGADIALLQLSGILDKTGNTPSP